MALVAQEIAHWPHHQMAVVGSSLGGFYASWVAQQTGCPAVLLNPAVNPARDLERYIGEQTPWHNEAERFYFDPDFIGELHALDVRNAPCTPHLGPQMAVIAQGDEVLDWREMVARYPQAQLHLLEGSDHALSHFSEHIDAVVQFLQFKT